MPDLKNKYSDPELNPANKDFDEIVNRPDMRALDDQGKAIVRDAEGLGKAEEAAGKTSPKQGGDVVASETNPDGFWTGRSDRIQLRGALSRFRNNRKALVAAGLAGGLVAAAIGGFLALLPLKFEMLVSTATSQASEIPEHAIERRLQFLTQYYIAQRILGQAYGQDIDVSQGSIIAGTFSAWRAANYEKKLGISIESDRVKPGERAFNWTIRAADGTTLRGNGGDVNSIINKISGTKNMANYIKAESKSATNWNQFYKRYAMRKTLMRKYGVSRWAWVPESASEKLDSYAERKRQFTRDIRETLRKNTIGRILDKGPNYMNCMTEGGDSCEELKDIDDQSNAQIEAQQDSRACGGDTGISCDEVDRNNEVYTEAANQNSENINNTKETLDSVDTEGADSKTISKLVSKQVLAKLVGGVGIIDTIFRAVNGVENGALNQVMFDRNSTAYIGYAAEILAINDQMKSGEIDIAQLGALMEVVGDFGASPAWQQTTGIIDDETAANSSYARECPTDEEGQPTTLPKGELVCSDRKVIHEKNPFEGQGWWEGLANVASAYMSSVGGVFGWVTDKLGSLTNVLGLDDLMKALGLSDLIAKGMETLINAIYGAPITGLEHGPDAGDNVIAGIQSSYFALGQTGQDLGDSGDGGGLGIGGAVISRSQTAALEQQVAAENLETNSRKSLFAKLFDTGAPESVASQAIIRIPTSVSEFANLPKVFFSSINKLVTPQTSAASTGNNAFGFNFSYSFTDAELAANPENYNEETCQQLYEAREESYGKTDEYPIMVYTKSDPCALEKVVAASGQSAFVDGPPQYFDLYNMYGDATLGGGSEFNIATFNVLGASHSDADYEARMDRSIKILNDNQVDIVGFQEFQSKQRAYFRQQIGSKYELFDKASGMQHVSGGEGVNAIGWDKSKFRLVTSGYMPNLKYFGGGNLEAPWVKLQDVETQQQFYILNTHDPARPENADLRLQNAKQHAEFVTTLKKQGLPIFFTGDFNSGYTVRDSGNTTAGGDPQNLTYCILTKGGLMNDAYDLGENRDVKCPNQGNDNSVDHIFLTDGSEVTRYWKSPGGKTKNGSDVHDTHMAAITIPAALLDGGPDFTVGSYNILHSDSHAEKSRDIGGCSRNPVPGDPNCARTRAELQVKVINGEVANIPAFDIFGAQEVSPDQYRILKELLPNYGAFPKDASRIHNQLDGAVALFWNKEKFTEFASGKFTSLSNVLNRGGDGRITNPWVGLQGANGQKVYITTVHYATATFGGTREKMIQSAQYATDWVKTVVENDSIVLVVGDMNDRLNEKLTYCVFTRNGILQHARDMMNGLSPNRECPAPNNVGASIDHIYATPTKGLKVTKWADPPMTLDPILSRASDHTPIYAKFSMPGEDTGATIGDWAWPVDKKWWQSNRADFLAAHPGTGTAWGGDNMGTTSKGAGIAVDIGDPPDGSPVYAMLGGVVTSTNLCGSNDGIAIKSKIGSDTVGISYMHGTGKKFNVGDTVKAGDKIMNLGAIGCNVSGGHVHIGIAYNGRYVCPQDIFLAMGAGKDPDLKTLVNKAAAPCGR